MQLKSIQNGRFVTIEIYGDVDTDTASVLNQALLELDYDNLDLTLDFRHTDYITSAGLRVLLMARKKLSEETMHVLHVNDSIAEVFRMTGFADIIPFTRDTSDGISYRMSFKSLLKRKCETHGDDHIFTFSDRGYTWKDIDCASQAIACDLSRLGVGKGTHVGLCAPNSINWVFTFFAIQKLGGIAVLMNFCLKPEETIRLSQIGDITHCCIGSLPQCNDMQAYIRAISGEDSKICNIYRIDNDVDFTARRDEYSAMADRFPEQFDADDASVMIFTSGSTGLPKAVLLSAYNILHNVMPVIDALHLGADDRNCAYLPMFHIFGFATSFAAAMLGDVSSYIPNRITPPVILDMIRNYRCTFLPSVPTLLLAITTLPEFRTEDVSCLRCAVLGGAAAGQSQMEMLMRSFPLCHFINLYGMSENPAVSMTGYDDSPEHLLQTAGRPVAGIEIQIRDPETGMTVPDGTAGEICIRSDVMMICYYRLSIDKQPMDGDGWLSTGDLGYLAKDGYLHLEGRIKDLIIRGGENLSPEEIAEAIAVIPGVKDVKVIGIPHAIWGEEVAAAVVMQPDTAFDEAQVRSYLATKLAKFKIPAYFVVLPSLPTLGSGKVDSVAVKDRVLARLTEMGRPISGVVSATLDEERES